MPIAQPAPRLDPPSQRDPVSGEAPRASHQGWHDFLPQKFYEIHQMEAQHSFHPDLPLNTIWGFNGIFPGPAFHARYGEPIIVRFHNDLPANHMGFGIPQTTTHLHNGHTASESHGFPGDFFDSGLFKDNHYPNILAGRDPRETLGTLWYHDHRFDLRHKTPIRGLSASTSSSMNWTLAMKPTTIRRLFDFRAASSTSP